MHGRTFTNISIGARGKAEDGMDLAAMQDFQSTDLTRLPKPEVIEAAVNRVVPIYRSCCLAQRWNRSSVPRFLSGRAAGVFFHEIWPPRGGPSPER